MEDNKNGITNDADEYDDADGEPVVTILPSDTTDEATVELMVGYARAGAIPMLSRERFDELVQNEEAFADLQDGLMDAMGIDLQEIKKECADEAIRQFMKAHPGEQLDIDRLIKEASRMQEQRVNELMEQWYEDHWK